MIREAHADSVGVAERQTKTFLRFGASTGAPFRSKGPSIVGRSRDDGARLRTAPGVTAPVLAPPVRRTGHEPEERLARPDCGRLPTASARGQMRPTARVHCVAVDGEQGGIARGADLVVASNGARNRPVTPTRAPGGSDTPASRPRRVCALCVRNRRADRLLRHRAGRHDVLVEERGRHLQRAGDVSPR